MASSSDDNEMVDVEGNEDFDSTGGLDSDKRAHHNLLERKRRDHIKGSFSVLRDSVPSLQGEKASRAQILNKATEFIKHMRQRNATHAADLERLQKDNEDLERQIRALEEEEGLVAALPPQVSGPQAGLNLLSSHAASSRLLTNESQQLPHVGRGKVAANAGEDRGHDADESGDDVDVLDSRPTKRKKTNVSERN